MVTMLAHSGTKRYVARDLNLLRFFVLAAALGILMPAAGYAFSPPVSGSTAVPFGAGAGWSTTHDSTTDWSSQQGFQIPRGEDHVSGGATDRFLVTPTDEGSLATAQQIVRRRHQREKQWSEDVQRDMDRSHRRLHRRTIEKPQRIRERIRGQRVRERIRETREKRQMPQVRRRLAARKVFRQMMTGADSSFRNKVWKNPRREMAELTSALRNARRLRDRRAELIAIGGLGNANWLLGRFKVSEDYFKQLGEMERQSQNVQGEAGALASIGAVRNSAGRMREALAASRQALGLYRQAKIRTGEAEVLNNMGLIFRNQDDYKKAVEALQSAIQADDTQDESKVLRLMNLAELHKAYANYAPARKSLEDALDIQKSKSDAKGQAKTLMSLASIDELEGQSEKAFESLNKALETLNKANEPDNSVKKRIGDLYLSLGQPDKAKPFIEESESESSLARYYLAVKSFPEAEDHFKNVLKAAQESGSPDDNYNGNIGLGLVSEGRGDLKSAERYFEKAIKAVEDIRSGLLPAERKNFYAASIDGFSRADAAKGLVRVRMKLNKPEQTIDVGEMTRAREFTDNISQRTDIANVKVPLEIIEKDVELQNVVASLEKARDVLPRDKDPERYDAVSRDLEKARADMKAFVNMLWERYRPYAAARHPRPIDLKQAAIGKEERVIILDVLGDGVAVKLLKSKKVVKADYVPWSSEELQKDVREFRKAFEAARLQDFNPVLAAKLYDRLLRQVISEVPKQVSITIIPDGILALLPFEALVTGGTATWKKAQWGPYPSGLNYLGDAHPVLYYQSLTALTMARELSGKEQGQRMLVVADPVFQGTDARAGGARDVKLAKADQEFVVSLMGAVQKDAGEGFKLQRLGETAELAEYLRNLYQGDTDVLTGLKANKNTFMSDVAPHMEKYGKLVLATHGLASNTLPGMMEPALALSMIPQGTDGFLTMSEVMGLNVQADVAALTACQTGLGRILAGEGVMSMGRAFQAAGAKTVLMSLWSVSEAGSVKLMEIFFKNLKSGMPKLQAWTLAREDLRGKGYDHPFFWAAFILVGEGE